jgi:hypothetical protein
MATLTESRIYQMVYRCNVCHGELFVSSPQDRTFDPDSPGLTDQELTSILFMGLTHDNLGEAVATARSHKAECPQSAPQWIPREIGNR